MRYFLSCLALIEVNKPKGREKYENVETCHRAEY